MGNCTKQDFLRGRNLNDQKAHDEMLTISSHKGNTYQNHTRFHFTLVRIDIIKNTNDNKFWQGCGEKRTLIHCWWECKLMHHPWKKIWRLLKILNIDLPCGPGTPLLGIYPKECTQVTPEEPAHPCLL
jgi:hypothetical protein